MPTLIQEYNEIIGEPVSLGATQQDLDTIGLYLDELERVEIYMESSSCTREEYADCEVERLHLVDIIDMMVQKV